MRNFTLNDVKGCYGGSLLSLHVDIWKLFMLKKIVLKKKENTLCFVEIKKLSELLWTWVASK